jgi:hypothetical protein
MKSSLKHFTLCIVGFVLIAGTAMAQDIQLMVNGDFDQQAKGWQMNDRSRNSIVSEDGNHFARLQQDQKKLTLIQRDVAIPKGVEEVEVSADMRGKNIDAAEGWGKNPRLMFFFLDSSGKVTGGYKGPELKSDSDEWVRLQQTIQVPEDAARIVVQPGLYSTSGTLDVDNVSVKVLKQKGQAAQPAQAATESAKVVVTEPRQKPYEANMLQVVEPASGASVDESNIEITVRVDPNNPQAFPTIDEGIAKAVEHRQAGRSCRLVIAPGVYREHDLILRDLTNDATLVIEAAEPGDVIVSGSEVFTDWWQDGGRYQHQWTRDWGVNRHWWEQWGITIEPLGLRRENVWIDGHRQTQVLDATQLKPGSFYIDEEDDHLVVMPPRGLDLTQTTVEVSTGTYGFALVNVRNVVMRGLTVQHFANTIGLREGVRMLSWVNAGGTPLTLRQARNVLLEDMTLRENNDAGVTLQRVEAVTLRRVDSSDNGGGGMNGARLVNVLLDRCTTNRNNWRGYLGGYTGWSMGGIKFSRLENVTFDRLTTNDNQTFGLWFDIWGEFIRIDQLEAKRNQHAGLNIEWQQGPIYTVDSVLEDNGIGVALAAAANVFIENTSIVGNASGFSMRDDNRSPMEYFKLKNNIIAARPGSIAGLREGTNPIQQPIAVDERGDKRIHNYLYWVPDTVSFGAESQALFMPRDNIVWKNFLQTLQAKGNTWYHPSLSQPFFDADRMPVDFDAWKKLTGDPDANWHN